MGAAGNHGMNRLRVCGGVGVLAAVLSACAGLPAQEMSDARQALLAARAAGAQRVVPATLEDAQARLQRAEAALRIHDYREARREAVEAGDRAREALLAAESLPPGSPPSPPTTLPAPPPGLPPGPPPR